MLYRKKFYPKEHLEITPDDGAKTRALIREHVDVRELETDFPSYTLDEHYLTKVEPLEPDAKALDIEAILDAEIRIRLDEDVRPLSERLDRIIEQKRAGTLAGIALLKELEELTAQVVEVVQEANRPVVETIGQEVEKRVEGVSAEAATADGWAFIFSNSIGERISRELCRRLRLWKISMNSKIALASSTLVLHLRRSSSSTCIRAQKDSTTALS
jgi:type I restriction enzyme R subunit